MTERPDPIEVLEKQVTALTDTHGNLAGLIAKTSRIQSELREAGLDPFVRQIEGIFAALSGVAEELQDVLHGVEIERNRMRNEA